MKTYRVEITETLQRTIEVEADSPDEAVVKAKAMYQDEDIVLGCSDYMQTEISLI